jgi:methionine aminopeptidase
VAVDPTKVDSKGLELIKVSQKALEIGIQQVKPFNKISEIGNHIELVTIKIFVIILFCLFSVNFEVNIINKNKRTQFTNINQ